MSRKRSRNPRVEPSPAPRNRRWLFRAVVLAVPWMALAALELSLRGFGYGVPMEFVVRQQAEGEERLLSNPYFTWLFFDPGVARLFTPFSLPVRKPANTCRVFVLGSSAAQGDPEPGFGIARMIEVLLRDQYPGVEFEVVNAATTAVNSHVVRSVAAAAAGLEPDLFVVYEGNNEVVGPFGAGTVLTSAAPNLAVLRAGIALRSTRIGQLLRSAVRGAGRLIGRGQAPGSWQGMEMFLDRPLAANDPRLERTYRHFEQNLRDTCRIARRASVPIVLSTVAVNLHHCAPFGSLHATTLGEADRRRWDDLYRSGAKLQESERWTEAAEAFRQADGIDPSYADLQFRRGRCASRLGQEAEAKVLYLRARDLDTLRFRADSCINGIVRQVATEEGRRGAVRLVDAAQWFEDRMPADAAAEAETFLDHVHFTFAGNYQLSVALLAEIREVLPAWVRAHDARRPPASEEQCAERLVFTELDRYLLAETMAKRLGQPPFTGQSDHAEQVGRFARELDTLRRHGESGAVAEAVRQYEQALAGERPRFEIRERYAVIEKRIGNPRIAEREWRTLNRQFPQYPSFQLQLARVLRDEGQYAEAMTSLRSVLTYEPESSLALGELARLALAQGQPGDARAYARRAAGLDPRDAGALYVLATSLCRQEPCQPADRAEAIDHLTKALEIAPDSEAVRRDLARAQVHEAQAQLAQGERARAVSLLERAILVRPGEAEAHEALGLLFQQANEREKAIRHLSLALEAEPGRERSRQALEALQGH
jgi:tetratricopeptide (TPR) repeat protein